MTQICPDCGKEFPDDYNYCNRCSAKLPKAKVRFSDYNPNLNPPEEKSEVSKEVEEAFMRYIMSHGFQKAFFNNLFKRVIQATDSDSECERYLCSEVWKVLQTTLKEEKD